jgi:TetR/AcrR family transcriptional repressor of nem operon
MRVSRAIMASHRSAILHAATRLFRSRGIATVPVAEVTREAGLTHGAFYGHFASKDVLAAEACRAGLADSAARWTSRAARARAEGRDPVGTLIDTYLTEQHRDRPEEGCVLAALGPEAARAGPPVSDALGEGVAALAAVLQDELARRDPATGAADRARQALGILATLTGGIVLARACRADPGQSRAVLEGAAALARAAAFPPPESR